MVLKTKNIYKWEQLWFESNGLILQPSQMGNHGKRVVQFEFGSDKNHNLISGVGSGLLGSGVT